MDHPAWVFSSIKINQTNANQSALHAADVVKYTQISVQTCWLFINANLKTYLGKAQRVIL